MIVRNYARSFIIHKVFPEPALTVGWELADHRRFFDSDFAAFQATS
ncbi:hypothetical protein [Echinicola sediminis]